MVVDSPGRDQRTLLRFITKHYAARDRPAFIAEIIAALPEVVPADSCWFREFSCWPPHVTLVVHPPEVKQETSERSLERHLNEHPGIGYRLRTFDPRAIRLSDFLTIPQFHHMALYREFYAPMRVEHQISVAVNMGPSTWSVIALGRAGGDFSARDRHCLNVLLPHLVEGYWNACALSTHYGSLPLSALGAAANVVTLNNAGQVRFVPPRAQRVLGDYFGNGVRSGHLPDFLERWFRHHTTTTTRGRKLPPVRQPFIVERLGKRLVIRLFSDGKRHALFLQEEITDRLLSLRLIGLTGREAQILQWLAQGKPNREIGAVLDIQTRTVGKHLERIFLKLGVENRMSAVLKAFGLVSETAPPPESR